MVVTSCYHQGSNYACLLWSYSIWYSQQENWATTKWGEEQVPIPHLILKLFFMYLNLEAYKEKIKTVISWQAKLGLSQCAEDDKRVLLEELASDNWSFSIN